MNMKNFYCVLLICLLGVAYMPVHGLIGINLFRPYDINLLTPRWQDTHVQWAHWGEFSYRVQGVNEDGHRVPVTQLWSGTQNALAMLQGFPANSPETEFLQNVLGGAMATDTRGLVRFNGKMFAHSYNAYVRAFLPHNMVLGIYIPVYDLKLTNVTITDLTTGDTPEDVLVREQLTSILKERVRMFDPAINLDGWHRTGFGDINVMAEWCRDFPQPKPALKNVFLTTRLGFNLPSGLKTNVNDIVSVPFGFDGSMGMIFGAGLILNWYTYVKGGLDFQFTYLFGNTRERRIKVDNEQTDLLLLAKAKTFCDFGFTQRYNLFLEIDPLPGLSFQAIYQFFKHTDDTLSICTNDFSDFIANTALNLQEWTMHHMIFKANYDFQCIMADSKSWFKPQLSLFAKFPFNGQRAILCSTVGASIVLNF